VCEPNEFSATTLNRSDQTETGQCVEPSTDIINLGYALGQHGGPDRTSEQGECRDEQFTIGIEVADLALNTLLNRGRDWEFRCA
jgi:hypothetical protein